MKKQHKLDSVKNLFQINLYMSTAPHQWCC